MNKKIGIAGLGAIGSAVARALQAGIEGYEWVAASEPDNKGLFSVEYLDFAQLAQRCDLIIECLPAAFVAPLAREVFARGRDLIIVSSAALILYPDIMEDHKKSRSRVIVPSGALAGIDGVNALAQTGITKAVIRSTKPPRGFKGAPYILDQKIDLDSIQKKQLIFSGTTMEAARGFPANVNVAATLSLAGIGPERTMVEIWADPDAMTNSHEIEVESAFSILSVRVDNKPDPANPKSSMLAAQSIISVLKNMSEAMVIL